MEAMSPQQETLGGQPGRSSSLTGVSRIAGGPGTKKVRTERGPAPAAAAAAAASPLPSRALRAHQHRAGRTPRGFNARGSWPERRRDLTLEARGPRHSALTVPAFPSP